MVKIVSSENTFANPALLGFFGFEITIFLLSLHNTRIIELSIAILAVTVRLDGIVQIIAGIFEMKF